MANTQNLKRGNPKTEFRSGRMAIENQKKSAESRKRNAQERKTMREIAKTLMDSKVSTSQKLIRGDLEKLGIPETEQTYRTAVVARTVNRALQTGDAQSVKLIAQLTGEMDSDGNIIDTGESAESKKPRIIIPDNGRDNRPENVIMPQAGPQTEFMASPADIVIYGGAAGGGKTYALLMEFLRNKDVQNFGGVIFRDQSIQIMNEGGLYDSSKRLYGLVDGAKTGLAPKPHWTFGGKSKITFSFIGCDADLGGWQGSQICYIGFDELTHFSKHQFLYMLSRNRSDCGVRPYVRATCNPDSDSWVAEFIGWWIDKDTGYPIPERSGVIRWMVNLNDNITWFDYREDAIKFARSNGLKEEDANAATKSVTFIASKLDDNKILLETSPEYRANLLALPQVEKERLLYGNWKIKAAAGLFFRRTQIGDLLPALPTDVIMWARGWDLAATSEDEHGDPAYTAGVLIGKRKNGRYIVADVINKRLEASEVRVLIKMTCQKDKEKYGRVIERLPQDPGQAGKEQAQSYTKYLAGFLVKTIAEAGDKVSRAEPFAAQWQAGNVDVLDANWNDMYFNELESFPKSGFKDMVDASSSAFNEIENGATYSVPTGSGLGKASYWNKK